LTLSRYTDGVLFFAKVVVGWQGSGDDCSEAEEEESIYSEEESGSVGGGGGPATYLRWVRWRGASTSSEARRHSLSVPPPPPDASCENGASDLTSDHVQMVPRGASIPRGAHCDRRDVRLVCDVAGITARGCVREFVRRRLASRGRPMRRAGTAPQRHLQRSRHMYPALLHGMGAGYG
jgi:hypothetical protein